MVLEIPVKSGDCFVCHDLSYNEFFARHLTVDTCVPWVTVAHVLASAEVTITIEAVVIRNADGFLRYQQWRRLIGDFKEVGDHQWEISRILKATVLSHLQELSHLSSLGRGIEMIGNIDELVPEGDGTILVHGVDTY